MNAPFSQKLVRLNMGGFQTIGSQRCDISQSSKETGIILRYSYIQITEKGEYVLSWACNHFTKPHSIKGKLCSAMIEVFEPNKILHLWFLGEPKGHFSDKLPMVHYITLGYRPQKSELLLCKPDAKIEDRIMSGSVDEFIIGLNKAINKNPSNQQDDVNAAQLLASKDTHPKAIDLFRKYEQAGPSPEKRILNEKAIKAFAIETACRVKTFIEQIAVTDWKTLDELKNAKRRKRKVDWVDRELAGNWIAKRYCDMGAKELAKAIFSVTRIRLTAAAIKKRRERLGLTTERNPGLLKNELATKLAQNLS